MTGRRIDKPCPSWCELEPGHDFDSIDTDTGRESVRSHWRSLSTHVDLHLTEYDDVPLSATPAVLLFSVDSDDMTAAQVRELAAEVLNGADELDKVTGAVSWTEDNL